MTAPQADMDRRSPMVEGEDHLTALPNELLATIVEQLPVREMCRLRSLSRHFRDFVDTNQGLLTQGLISYHRTRINREYSNLTDLSDCDIVRALRRYKSHYGFDYDPDRASVFSLDPFKHAAMTLTLDLNWTRSYGVPCGRGTAHWLQTIYFLSATCMSTSRSRRIEDLWDFTEQPESFGFPDRESFVAKFMELLSTDVGVAYPAVPPFFLTDRKVFLRYSCISPKIHKGHCDYRKTSELQLLLHLPDLKQDEGTLAYCFMSGDTVHLVNGVDQGPSNMLKQAAIIEDILIW